MTAKVLAVQVPFYFKYAVDALTVVQGQDMDLGGAQAVSIALLMGYGMAKVTASVFHEIKTVVFARVTQKGMNEVARSTFLHLMEQDLKFHLSRNTGALARTIDRGTRGISAVLNTVLFNVVPTVLEIGLVCGILYTQCGPKFMLITIGTMTAYTVFTVLVTNWRYEMILF